MELFFDTETTGKALFKEPHDHPGQPNIIQLACILSDENEIYSEFKAILDPSDSCPGWVMDPEAEMIHGISRPIIEVAGLSTKMAMVAFSGMLNKSDRIVCHNVQFDKKLVMAELSRCNGTATLEKLSSHQAYCTMQKSTKYLNLPGKFGPKWPKLSELHQFLFNEDFDGAHDALNDVRATRRCYYELIRRGIA